jgi:predicted acylesterase/phospholipase RssA
MASRKLPLPECDLVMKGGVTSGIVYPPAILKLKDRYIFNSIGGTSAGAVAAAAAAAAEYGRYGPGDSFDRFQKTSDHFIADLLHRFDVPGATRPAFQFMKAVGVFGGPGGHKPSPPQAVLQATGSLAVYDAAGFWPLALLGGILGAATGVGLAAIVAALTGSTLNDVAAWAWVLGIIFLLIGAWVGGLLGGALHLGLSVLMRKVPDNFYGVVTGHDPKVRPDSPVLLTDYLAEGLDRIAGLPASDGPLTFGHLCRRKISVDGVDTDAGITLQLITSNLSQGIPYRLPFTQRIFLYKKPDMERLFPGNVVRQLFDHRYRSDSIPDDNGKPPSPDGTPAEGVLPEGYYFLPDADDFPVVVAMRMSLSIPIFFSAIPLYSIKPGSFDIAHAGGVLHPDRDLQQHLFSDGGVTSNFPIHSFDKWLPSRPTFGITLAAMPSRKKGRPEPLSSDYLSVTSVQEDERDLEDLGEVEDLSSTVKQEHTQQYASGPASPDLLKPVELGQPSKVSVIEWRPIRDPISLLFRVVDTARENHDYLQSTLPGYRERIVKIRFTPEEGGMNLAMDQDAINAIKDRGAEAGAELLKFNFGHHQWTRFLVLMSELELQLQKLRGALERGNYEELLLDRVDSDSIGVVKSYPYLAYHGRKWRHKAYLCITSLVNVLDEWEQITSDQPMQPAGQSPPATAEPQPTMVSGLGGDTPRSMADTNCDSAGAPLSMHFFNGEAPEQDRTPKPRGVLRVTPNL